MALAGGGTGNCSPGGRGGLMDWRGGGESNLAEIRGKHFCNTPNMSDGQYTCITPRLSDSLYISCVHILK